MKTREAYYDNAKFILIFFVVFGHFIQSYTHHEKWIYILYTTIYTFHMPAFILISGFFAKGFRKTGYVKKIAKKLILPYLIFQSIYSFYYYLVDDLTSLPLDPFNPHWSLWFLVSLFCWNLMLFLFTKWKTSLALVVSITIGLFVGYFYEISNYLSLSRTFVFFPFFLIGYSLQKEHFDKLREMKFKYISLFILATIFITFYFLPSFDHRWLFASKPYAIMNDLYINGGIMRLGVYAITLVATFSILALVPRQSYFFTKWGTSSLYIYLLHGFFVQAFRRSELVEVLKNIGPGIVPLLFIISFTIIAFLSSRSIQKLTQPLIELRFSNPRKQRVESIHEER